MILYFTTISGMEAQPQQLPAVPVVSLAPVGGNAAIFQADLQTLYDKISAGLGQMMKDKPNTLATLIGDLQPIMVAITITVRDYSANRNPPLDNAAKQALALTLLKYILQKLNQDGHIPADLYNNLSTAVDFFGPTLINGSVALMHKAEAVEQDIAQNGCHGCCQRNCSVM